MSVVEPNAAVAFLAAYAVGDDAVVARVASPLYAAEWTRRDLGAHERNELLPQATATDGAVAPWITFQYAGASIDASGFQHLIYTASQPACYIGCHASGVWRLDAEQSGAVIWAELVWLFSDHVSAVVTSHGVADLPHALLPGTLLSRDPRLVVAVHSATGPEGYYAVAINDDPRAVVFFAIGPEGDVRPGAWSYGERSPGLVEYGRPPVEHVPALPVAQATLQQSYAAGLP